MQLSEQIYTDLKSILPDLKEAMETGVSYGGDLFERFIMYDILINSFLVLSLVIAIVIAIVLLVKSYSRNYDDEVNSFMTKFTLACIIICIAIPIGVPVSNILKDIFIPEIRVIEVIKNLN